MTFAAPLNPGDTIAVVAPSAALAEDDAAQGIAFLKELGYHSWKPYRLISAIWPAVTNCGRPDINAAFADDQVKAIICLRGGYGSNARAFAALDHDGLAFIRKFFRRFQ